MNSREYLFTVLAEEASEVAQATSKTIRFGNSSFVPQSRFTTNAEHLVQEINEMIAMVELLGEFGYLDITNLNNVRVKEAKKIKVTEYLELAENMGVVID